MQTFRKNGFLIAYHFYNPEMATNVFLVVLFPQFLKSSFKLVENETKQNVTLNLKARDDNSKISYVSLLF